MSKASGRRLCRLNFCNKDITNQIHISCAQCADFDICLNCFSCGTEQDDHVHNHPYRVIDNMKFELFDKGWGADEELKLLDAIEKFGIGNWYEIGEVVGKSSDEVQKHYLECYIQSKTSPLPMLPSPGTVNTKLEPESESIVEKFQTGHNATLNANCSDNAPLGFSTFAGYYPKRDDYEQEHNNASESLVSGLVFYDDDSKLDKNLKTAMLRIYNRKLNERQIRKEFCVKHDIVGNNQMSEYFQNEDFRETFDRYRIYARFQTPTEFKLLMETLYSRFLLAKKVVHYQECRKAGISRLKDIPKYEVAKKRQLGITKDGRRGSSTTVGRPRAGSTSGGPRKNMTAAQNSTSVLFGTLPSCNLLSNEELELCQSVGLLPSQLLRLKSSFLRQDQRSQGLSWDAAKNISGFNDLKTAKVYLFMEDKGWITGLDKKSVAAMSHAPPPPQPPQPPTPPLPTTDVLSPTLATIY
eukprot:m.197935 g.197935  ORF g.197935 m.197935 type:complete len:468 (-) comp32671_c1_seq1:217-1620(-)